jgi:hypothetical protein
MAGPFQSHRQKFFPLGGLGVEQLSCERLSLVALAK